MTRASCHVLCDEVLVLEQGRVTGEAPPERMLAGYS